jgi:hypothetical protein
MYHLTSRLTPNSVVQTKQTKPRARCIQKWTIAGAQLTSKSSGVLILNWFIDFLLFCCTNCDSVNSTYGNFSAWLPTRGRHFVATWPVCVYVVLCSLRTYIIMVRSVTSPWRWRQHGPPKRLHRTTSLHGVTTWRWKQHGRQKRWYPTAFPGVTNPEDLYLR